jgi:chloramphenicol 3-O phosphotransferase
MSDLGQVIILNGPPRSGKTSIALAIQETIKGVWMNLGVDSFMRMTPPRLHPGIGLRPGGERPDLESHVALLYAAMYESVAAHSRLGINVVMDVGHHDAYSRPLGILPDCARRLRGLPVLVVGINCPIEVIMQRRIDTGWQDAGSEIPSAVVAWQREVHIPGIYDLELDTSQLDPPACARAIQLHLQEGPRPTAISKLAAM